MMKAWRCVILPMVILVGWSSAAAADRPNAIPPTVAYQIHRLASTHWKVRHAAERALLLAPAEALSAIDAAYIGTTNPEFAARLERIGLQLYLERAILDVGRRPFLGIRFYVLSFERDRRELSAVYVARVLRGFPAARKLRRGDMIVGINGHSFGPDMTEEDFVQLMAQFQPQTHVQLTVWRSDRMHPINLRVRLIGAPANDLSLLTWVSERAGLISRYLQYLAAAKRVADGPTPHPAQSPLIFPSANLKS